MREENAAAPPELAACILSHVTLNNASYPAPAGGAISAVGACLAPQGRHLSPPQRSGEGDKL